MAQPKPVNIFFYNVDSPKECINNDIFTTMPFTEGQTITLEVVNMDTDFWDVEEMKKRFKIDKIDFKLKTYYPSPNVVSTVNTTLDAYIYVIELE